MKLLLSSIGSSPEHDAALVALVGKPLPEIRVAYIENAYDVYDDQASLVEGRETLRRNGYAFDLIDLREWRGDRAGLRALLERFDAVLLTGGNPYYLRALMKVTGADEIITDLVRDGMVYAAASAAAVVAGPTLRHFDELDDPARAEELIMEGLGLTHTVVAPHVDNAEFGGGIDDVHGAAAPARPVSWPGDASPRGRLRGRSGGQCRRCGGRGTRLPGQSRQSGRRVGVGGPDARHEGGGLGRGPSAVCR